MIRRRQRRNIEHC